MKKSLLKCFFAAAAFFSAGLLHADDSAASAIYAEGRELYIAGKYYDAAKKFEECRYSSGNPTVRANSLIAQIAAYRMCKLYYREFKLIEELLERYPDHADCKELIAREFEIGRLFRNGAREPAFWVFRWIPYLVDEDRTAEVYTTALERAPFSEHAPAARMQLAIFYDLENQTLKSIGQLREIVEKHPAAAEYKFALLALANGLFELSGRGDGDSRYINEAVKLFRLFCDKYPDATEIEFARTRLARAKDVQAAKLVEIADFYRKSGRSDVAERYLAQVMSTYPDSKSAAKAEKTLVNISTDYLPGDLPARVEPRYPDIRSYPIPPGAEVLLMSPAEKGSPYLFYIGDVKGERLPALLEAKEGGKSK
ncbi:MAG: outer membrane protein assembly factor BamD [Lentisphaerae bacterium]|nr:outer membrane protein assembly factor BamD [Lentisphaerota bacterium]